MSLADDLVRVASTRLGRRGVLGKAAVVGSAAVVAPLDFALRPTTAYAAVCRGGLCSTGYTEFCCTLTGVNACPAGTVTGGWWKVDGSQFCGGAPRFYLDCNSQCGSCGCGAKGLCDGSCSGTGCGCANGDCANWKTGCNKFRYGQCNQNVPCVGPIVCRVVTCTPPWLFDPACGTTSRTDNNTRFHSRPCVEDSFGAIDRLEPVDGELRVTGWAFNQANYQAPALIRVYLDGVVWADLNADGPRRDVAAVYPNFGLSHGFELTTRVPPGRHFVCVFAIDRATGRGTAIAFREIDVPGPVGAIDVATVNSAGAVRVVGWASDPTRPNDAPLVRVRVDGNLLSDLTADLARGDVAVAVGRSERCGFDVTVNAPGGREVCVEVIDRFGATQRVACAPIAVAAP